MCCRTVAYKRYLISDFELTTLTYLFSENIFVGVHHMSSLPFAIFQEFAIAGAPARTCVRVAGGGSMSSRALSPVMGDSCCVCSVRRHAADASVWTQAALLPAARRSRRSRPEKGRGGRWATLAAAELLAGRWPLCVTLFCNSWRVPLLPSRAKAWCSVAWSGGHFSPKHPSGGNPSPDWSPMARACLHSRL